MQRGNPRENLTVVNTHKHSDGIKVRIFVKGIFYHEPSLAIIGTIYHGHNVDRGIHYLLSQNIIRRNQNNNLIVTRDSPLQYL